MAQKGIVFVISAPSGAGKQTVIRRSQEEGVSLATTISATTRPPRSTETDGHDYYFLSMEDFQKRVAENAFVELAEVHGNLYGTLSKDLDRCINSGQDVVMEVDVQGLRSLAKLGYDVVSIFIMPPSVDELERRLRRRGTDSDAVIQIRLRNAKAEMDARKEYDYVVVNDNLEAAVANVAAIICAEHCRSIREK